MKKAIKLTRLSRRKARVARTGFFVSGNAAGGQGKAHEIMGNDFPSSHAGHSCKTVKKITAVQFRGKMAETLDHVSRSGNRVTVTRHGRPVAVVAPMEDLELLEAIEDAIDIQDAKTSLAEPGLNVSWQKVKADLGL